MNIILIYSGGMDSTALLCKLLREGHQVRCLSINYGQRHRVELDAAEDMCTAKQVEHRVVDLTTITPLLAGSSQTDPKVDVPRGHYADENMKLTIVPNRNMLMLAVAGAWAISVKADAIAYAAHAGDHAIYPDCRPEFTEAMEKAFLSADWHQVALLRPFIAMSKADIIREAARLGHLNELSDSYSCYEGRGQHCGACGTCVERRMAYIEAGIEDPTTYEQALDPKYVTEAQEKNLEAKAVN